MICLVGCAMIGDAADVITHVAQMSNMELSIESGQSSGDVD